MLLLSTSSLTGYGLHKIFNFAHKAGFDGLDISLGKLNYDYWDEDYIKELSNSFNIPVLSITAPNKGMDEKTVDRIIKISLKLGAQLITFSPPYFTDKNTNWFSKYLLKIKKDLNISIAVQNVESKFRFFILPEYKNSTLYEIKKITGDTSLDLSSIDKSSGLDILKAQKILGNSIQNILLNDRHGIKDHILPGLAGGGISYLPLESFFMKLKTTGYKGFITLKVKPNELGIGKNDVVIQKLKNCITYYKKHFLNYK